MALTARSIDGILTRATENDPTLTYVHLHRLDVKEAEDLAVALGQNTYIYHLDLSGIPSCNIGDEGAAALAPFLRTNSALRTFLCCDNEIGPRGAVSLAEALADNVALTWLDLKENRIFGGGGVGRNDVASAFGRTLALNTTLLGLDLAHTNMGDDDIVAVSSALCENSTMKTLRLACNNIGPCGAMSLAHALARTSKSGLENINVYGNKVEDKGAQAFAVALRDNESIRSIELGHNGITDIGARALADNFCHNRTIKDISLAHNPIVSVALRIDYTMRETTSIFSALMRINSKNTTELNLGGCDFGREDWALLLVALSHTSTVKVIDLSDNCIGDSGATAIAEVLTRNRTIEDMKLRSSGIRDVGAMALASALGSNNVLRKMNVRDNRFGSSALFAFAESLLGNYSVEQMVLRARGGRHCRSKASRRIMGRVRHYVGTNKYNSVVKLAASEVLKENGLPDILLPLAFSRMCRDCTVAYAVFRKVPHTLHKRPDN